MSEKLPELNEFGIFTIDNLAFHTVSKGLLNI